MLTIKGRKEKKIVKYSVSKEKTIKQMKFSFVKLGINPNLCLIGLQRCLGENMFVLCTNLF